MKISVKIEPSNLTRPDFVDDVHLILQYTYSEVIKELEALGEDPSNYEIIATQHKDEENNETISLEPKRIRFECERCSAKVRHLHMTLEGEVCEDCREEIDDEEEECE